MTRQQHSLLLLAEHAPQPEPGPALPAGEEAVGECVTGGHLQSSNTERSLMSTDSSSLFASSWERQRGQVSEFWRGGVGSDYDFLAHLGYHDWLVLLLLTVPTTQGPGQGHHLPLELVCWLLVTLHPSLTAPLPSFLHASLDTSTSCHLRQESSQASLPAPPPQSCQPAPPQG